MINRGYTATQGGQGVYATLLPKMGREFMLHSYPSFMLHSYPRGGGHVTLLTKVEFMLHCYPRGGGVTLLPEVGICYIAIHKVRLTLGSLFYTSFMLRCYPRWDSQGSYATLLSKQGTVLLLGCSD